MAILTPAGDSGSSDTTALGQLSLPDLQGIFANLNTPTVADSAQQWGQLGSDVSSAMSGAGSTSLTGMATTSLQSWSGAGSEAFKQKLNTVATWGEQLGTAMGAGTTAGRGSVSGVLDQVNTAMAASYTDYANDLKPTWEDFTNHAASFFNTFTRNATAVANGGQPAALASGAGYDLTPTSFPATVIGQTGTVPITYRASYTENTYTANASITATMALSVPPSFSDAHVQLLPGPTPAPVASTPAQVTAGGPTVSAQDIEGANRDQYRFTLVSELTGLSNQYRTAAAAFPAKMTPLSSTSNPVSQSNGFTGSSGGTGAAISAPNVSAGTTGVKGAPSSSTVGAGTGTGTAGVPGSGTSASATTPTTGSSAPTAGSASSGLGSSGSATGSTSSGATTPTSLASAPTASSSSQLGATGTSGLGGSSLGSSGTGLGTTSGLGSSGLGSTSTGLAGTGAAGTSGGGIAPILPIGTGGAFSGSGLGGLGGSGGLSGAGPGGGIAGDLAASDADNAAGDSVIGSPDALDDSGAAAGTAAQAGLSGAATTAGRTSPSMPYMPMSQGMTGGNEERGRSVWLDEDDDVWSSGTDPAPAVIGGEI